ncbi:ribosome-inactivating family protein [Streptomyces guryensis]|uniref:Ribosome-inactivating family protein n=1 Tax=Streptomyces guryensis TaxID=2886947 RepID=A0A9Q3VWI6_9ACTN|nr:ribosome-inactivating family protein [Streptomyces guryensis]MCD9879721.1 ribosome-inactivating family protein [Streptomyces guryensis]
MPFKTKRALADTSPTDGAAVSTRAFRRLGVSVVISAALAGAVALNGVHLTPDALHSSASTSNVRLNSQDLETVSFAERQIHWNVEDGPDGAKNFANMINELRTAASAIAGASRRSIVDADGVTRQVDTTDSSQSDRFADIIATLPASTSHNSATVHIRVRLNDFYVVQFFTVNPVGGTSGYTLGSGVPTLSEDDRSFPEQYDELSNRSNANRPLVGLRLGHQEFHNAVTVLAGTNSNHQAIARAIQTFIVGIAEAARFRPIATGIAARMKKFDSYVLGQTDVQAMHNWSRASQIYRNNGGASISLYGRAVNTAASAAVLLMTALGAKGLSKVPKSEL